MKTCSWMPMVAAAAAFASAAAAPATVHDTAQPDGAAVQPGTAAAHPGIPGILAPGSKMQQAHTGFQFTEGPAADPDGNVYFTDLARSVIHIARTDGTLETFMEQTQGVNGLFFDSKGRLLACQGGAGRIIAIDPASKEITPLAESFDGRPLGRVNDLVPDAHGGIYFSDPMLGRRPEGDTTPAAVYYLSSDGRVTRVIDDLAAPNGVLLSPDGKTLYVLPYTEPRLMAYPVEGPGKLGAGRELAELDSPPGRTGRRGGGDGLTVDVNGVLYVAVPSARSVQVFAPDGKKLGTIDVPEAPANCAFGGPDFRTLFITARTSVYTVPLEVKGHRPW